MGNFITTAVWRCSWAAGVAASSGASCGCVGSCGPQPAATSLSNQELIYKPNGAWSIKEHLGHLIDLEPLHRKRLKEFVDMKEYLTMADMSNTATEKADHNSESIDNLLLDFNRSRNDLIAEYHTLTEESLLHDSIHPRLKVPMKPVDLLFFVAEHDDHHLAGIQEIIQELKK